MLSRDSRSYVWVYAIDVGRDKDKKKKKKPNEGMSRLTNMPNDVTTQRSW